MSDAALIYKVNHDFKTKKVYRISNKQEKYYIKLEEESVVPSVGIYWDLSLSSGRRF